MKILVAEDDANILNALCEILETEGYKTARAANGQDALSAYESEKPDFICLDIMMPDLSGYDVCRTIRAKDANTPIIFLSAKSEEIDRVLGLELGADDYIVKPFGVQEVVARIRAVARRTLQNRTEKTAQDEPFMMQDLTVYPIELRAAREGESEDIELSLRDVRILQLLYGHKGEIVDRDKLLDECWGEHIMPESRTVDQHISQLRKRIEKDPQDPQIIRTVHGAGYRYAG